MPNPFSACCRMVVDVVVVVGSLECRVFSPGLFVAARGSCRFRRCWNAGGSVMLRCIVRGIVITEDLQGGV